MVSEILHLSGFATELEKKKNLKYPTKNNLNERFFVNHKRKELNKLIIEQ